MFSIFFFNLNLQVDYLTKMASFPGVDVRLEKGTDRYKCEVLEQLPTCRAEGWKFWFEILPDYPLHDGSRFPFKILVEAVEAIIDKMSREAILQFYLVGDADDSRIWGRHPLSLYRTIYPYKHEEDVFVCFYFSSTW